MKIRVLIVDDEPLARSVIRHWLADKPDAELVAECGNGAAALACLRAQAVDLVFLDVQMPEMDGFAFLRRARGSRIPAVVFVTAFDKYAVRAFEAHALDYLLKPFDKERFDDAFARAVVALQQSRAEDWQARLRALVASMDASPSTLGSRAAAAGDALPDRLTVKEGGRILLLPVAEIDWVEAEGDYVRLHAGSRRHLVHDTLHHLASQLDPRRFLRVHRSAIVNLERIRELVPTCNGEFDVLLNTGHTLRASRSHRDALLVAVSGPRR